MYQRMKKRLQNRKSEPLLMIQGIAKKETQQKTLLFLMFSHKLHSQESVQRRKSVCVGRGVRQPLCKYLYLTGH